MDSDAGFLAAMSAECKDSQRRKLRCLRCTLKFQRSQNLKIKMLQYIKFTKN